MYLISPNASDLTSSPENVLYHPWFCENCLAQNAVLYARFSALSQTDFMERTHLFNGRYENLYVDRIQLPEIEVLLASVISQAASLLQLPEASLRLGFWFNVMQPGHTTSLHSHDDDDELLSGVYYLKVPDKSGQLLLHPADEDQITITPEEGLCVFFSPELPHEVTKHEGVGERISIAFNVGAVN